MKQIIKTAAPGLYDALSEARQRVRDRLFPTSETVTLPSGLRADIHGFADRCMYDDIFVAGEYDRAITLAVTAAPEPSVILDLGANVGYFGLRAADRWIQACGPAASFLIVGFEGSPEVHADLERRLDQPLLAGKCYYHLGLVGQRTGKAFISHEAYHFKRAIVASPSRAASSVDYLDVEQLVAPDTRIRLLKSNIEGAEGPFIEGYRGLLTRVDVAVFQFHHDNCDVDLAVQRLHEAGLVTVEQRTRDINNQSYGVFANPAFVRL